MAQSLETRLTASIKGLGGTITSLKTRQGTQLKNSAVLRPLGSPAELTAAEVEGRAKTVATTDAIKVAILQNIHASGPAIFLSKKSADLSIQWATMPTTANEPAVQQTTLAELPCIEDAMGKPKQVLRKILHESS